MPIYNVPGVYVEEVLSGNRPIAAQSTSTPVFVGTGGRKDAPRGVPTAVTSWTQYATTFLGDGPMTPLSHAVNGFFLNTQGRCYVLDIGQGSLSGTATSPGLAVLEPLEDIAIVAAPGYTTPADYEAVIGHCEAMRDRVAILDVHGADAFVPTGNATADQASVGKPVGNDLRRGLITLPTLRYAEAHGSDLDLACALRGECDRVTYDRLIDRIRHSDAIEAARHEASSAGQRAVLALRVFPDSPHRAALIGLVDEYARRVV